MRLIDADILKIAFEEKGLSPVTSRIVDNVPTVDAEPVVHCKDCTFRDKYGYCVAPMGEVGYARADDDDFCSCGYSKKNEPSDGR